MKLRNKFLIVIISFIIFSLSIVQVGAVENLSDRADALSRDIYYRSSEDTLYYTRSGSFDFVRPRDNRDFIPTDNYSSFSHVRTRSNIVSWGINIVTPSGVTTVPEYFNIDSWLKITLYKYVRPSDSSVFHSIAFETLDADQNSVSFTYDFTSYTTDDFQGLACFVGDKPSNLTPLFRSEINYSQPNYNITTSSDGTYAPAGSSIPAYVNDGACVYFQETIASSDLASYFNLNQDLYFFLIPTYSGSYSIREWVSGDVVSFLSFYNLISTNYNYTCSYDSTNSKYNFTYSINIPILSLESGSHLYPNKYYTYYNGVLGEQSSYAYQTVILPVQPYERYYITSTAGKYSMQHLCIFTDSNNNVISTYGTGNNVDFHSYVDELVSVPEGATKMIISSYQYTPRLKILNYFYNPVPFNSYSLSFTDSNYGLSNNKTTGPVFIQDQVNNKIKASGSFPKYYLSDSSDICTYVLTRNQYNIYSSSDSDQKTYDDVQNARDDYINASNELSEALDGFEELNKPDVDAVKDIIHSEQIDNALAGISSFSPIYQTIFDQDIVLEMLMISLTFVFIGYILFGKRN